ncbi:unnamed protein product [Amaranthus hypochondriacus]
MKVMVGLDESNGSLYALEWVISNILKPKQDTDQNQDLLVYLVHVNIPFQTYVYPAGPVVYTTSSVLESVRQAQDQISAGIFARAMDTCHKYEIKAEAISLRGDPKEEICQAADQKQVDLLVVGSRGLGMLKRAFLGSVSDYCAHHVKCPVLIVKPPKELADKQEQVQRKA